MRVGTSSGRAPAQTAAALRAWAPARRHGRRRRDRARGREGGEQALLRLTARFDATERAPGALRVERRRRSGRLAALEPGLRTLELAAANVRTVAEAQIGRSARGRTTPGPDRDVREVSVGAGRRLCPGGRAAYPSSVLMCAFRPGSPASSGLRWPHRPAPTAALDPLVLAAAALCEVDEIYAMGGAQAIFALAHGTETVAAGRRDRRPRQRLGAGGKARGLGRVGIDSLAGPSELMLIAGHDTDPEWAAFDLCAQAEHGADSPLVAVAVEERCSTRWRGRPSGPPSDPTLGEGAAGAGPGAGPRATRRPRQRLRPRAPRAVRGGRGAARRAGEDRWLRVRRALRRHRFRRLCRRLQPRAADRRRGPLLRATRSRRVPPQDHRP